MKFASKMSRNVLLKERGDDEYCIKRIHPSRLDNIIDIGANIGVVSTLARLCHPKSTIHAFEPNDDIFDILKENTKELGINVYQEAMGDGSYVKFLKRRGNLAHCFKSSGIKDIDDSDIVNGHMNEDLLSIKTMRLHDMLKKYDIEVTKKTLIKIDCEGGEWHLRNKLDVELLKKAGVVCFEVHEIQEHGSVLDFFKWALSHHRLSRTFGMNFFVAKGGGHMILWDKTHFKDLFF